LNKTASKYNILSKSLQQWKKQFLEYASLAFENSIPTKKIQRRDKRKKGTLIHYYQHQGKQQ